MLLVKDIDALLILDGYINMDGEEKDPWLK
jgi:hypothetical protein